jgi:hypothetical protein
MLKQCEVLRDIIECNVQAPMWLLIYISIQQWEDSNYTFCGLTDCVINTILCQCWLCGSISKTCLVFPFHLWYITVLMVDCCIICRQDIYARLLHRQHIDQTCPTCISWEINCHSACGDILNVNMSSNTLPGKAETECRSNLTTY